MDPREQGADVGVTVDDLLLVMLAGGTMLAGLGVLLFT